MQPLLRAVGEKGVHFFKRSFELKIKGDMIPESAVESTIGDPIVEKILEFFAPTITR